MSLQSPRTAIFHFRAGATEGDASAFFGHTLPSDPDAGAFASWRWDGNELTARTDPFGGVPLFYFARPGEFAVSPSVRALVERGAPRALDDDALAVFLRLGYFLAEDTPFRDVRAAPPGATLRWSPAAGLTVTSAPLAARPSGLTRDAALGAYLDLFAQAIRRRPADGPVVLPLSGGRDSRHILFQLCALGQPPDLAVTIDLRTNDDGLIAAQLAAALNVPHRMVPAPPASLERERLKNEVTHFCSDEHTWTLALPDALPESHRTLYDGIGGDVLSAGLFLTEHVLGLFRAGRFEELARHMLTDEHSSRLTPLLRPEAAERFGEDRAVSRLVTELRRHADAPNPCGAYRLWNRTRREIALLPFAILGDRRAYTPYMDADVAAFLLGLPAEHVLDHQFHDDAIARGFPRWASVPYAAKRAPGFRLADLGLAWGTYWWLRGRRTSLNLDRLLPRLLRATFDPFYNRRAGGFLTAFPVYWAQLEELAGTGD